MRISRQLIFITLTYFVLRLPWLFSVPMVEAPDEFSHYWVLRFIAEHLRLPSAAEVAGGGASAVYGSLPQMGYLPHVLVCKLLPIGDLSLVGRFGSILIGLVTVLTAYFIGQELFASAILALSLPILILFHPQLVFVNSYSNSDSTACALTTLILYLVVRMLKRGVTAKAALLIGFLLGWDALTKYSVAAIFPTVLVGLLLTLFIHRVSFFAGLKYLALVACMFFLTCGWWFIHSMSEFHGDILGTKTMRDTWARTYNKPLEFHIPLSHVIKDQVFWSTIHDSFWGLFGYVSRFLYPQVYWTYLVFLWLAIAGGARGLLLACLGLLSWLQRVKAAGQGFKNSQSSQETGAREFLVVPSIWFSFGVCCFVNIASMVVGASMNLGGAQGRYLFPSEVAIMALLIAGLSKLGKFGTVAVVALAIFNAVVCAGSFYMLMHTAGYGFTTKLY